MGKNKIIQGLPRTWDTICYVHLHHPPQTQKFNMEIPHQTSSLTHMERKTISLNTLDHRGKPQ